MTWTSPTYVEVKMDAEFSAYVDDLAADLEPPDVPDRPDDEGQ